ncbi:proton-coupled folate transporter-like [Uloborus diversus]|uniref:proton-coupled folate transporter-like n=1 Tax=Uloborus diversus TaxID=327109 RepID=UPI0024099336|nr:proton-coupled folate transporter-like [Uloborus diversus]
MDETKTKIPKSSTPLKKNDTTIQYGGLSTGDDVPLLTDAFTTQSRFSKIYETVCSLTIEPVMFSFMFAFVMNMIIVSNMIMDKGCLYYYNYSREVCQNLSGHPDVKETVEILANNYSVYCSLTSFLGALGMVFIAPWSDKYGRKPPVIVAMFGVLLTDVGMMLCAYYFDSKLEYLVLARVPGELFGGLICVLTVVFSHASEVSTEKNRTVKYTCVEVALGLGVASGMLTAGLLYKYYGYIYVYITSAALHFFSVPWTIFCVKETVGLDSKASWKQKMRDFFNFESLRKNISVAFRKREGHTRALLFLSFASMCCCILTYEAYASIGFIYVHQIFNWDPSRYSTVSTTAQIAQMACTLALVPIFVGFFKMRDSTLGIIGTVSMLLKNLFYAFAKEGYVFIYYIGILSGIFSSLSTLAIRSFISKLIDKEELGRVFSFLATCEAIVPTLGTIAVTKVFNATIEIYPSVSYLMTVGILALPLLTFILASKLTSFSSKQDTFHASPINEKGTK